jgi:hypothetical protein
MRFRSASRTYFAQLRSANGTEAPMRKTALAADVPAEKTVALQFVSSWKPVGYKNTIEKLNWLLLSTCNLADQK